jgi:hypothetical protein
MTKERIKKLREWVQAERRSAQAYSLPYHSGCCTDILSALEELEKVRPLVEAVESDGEITVVGTMSPKAQRIIRAALKFREGRKP